jgi:surface protein
MSYLFYSCEYLTDLDLSHFNTSNMTSMIYMFQDCKELTTLNLSNFDTSKVSGTIYGLFNRCDKLHTLRLDNCSNDTINKIITSTGFPTGTIEGVTRKIYCKEANAAGLTAPTNWEFEYVD